jgi:uncharacterized protein
LRDELSQPLTGRPRKAASARRLAPVLAWAAPLVLVAVAGALYARGAFSPPKPQVATLPFEAIKTVEPSPTPSPVTVAKGPPGPEGSVSVMRNAGATQAGGRGPQIIDVAQALGSRLAPVPDKRLVEPSKYGPLPRVGAEGARPSEVYARPFADTQFTRGAPRIAIFIGGLGLDPATTQGAIARLPGAVSLGLAPYGADLTRVVESARAAGHEVWLQAPMESVAAADPGPHTLKTSASEAENRESLHWLMGRLPGYVGVTNYLGGKFAADADALTPVLTEIGRRGLLYLDDGAAPLSKAAEIAPTLDLKAARADLVADGPPDAVDAVLARAEDLARRKGAAIVTASALPQTLDHVSRWAAGLEAKGFALAPVSTLVTAKPERAARTTP